MKISPLTHDLAAALNKAAHFIENAPLEGPERTEMFFAARHAWQQALRAYHDALPAPTAEHQCSN